MGKLVSIEMPNSLNRIAYKALREAILGGRLKSGEMYNEMKLAEELGISRTPVREALLELSAKGLITFIPRKGVQVSSFTLEDVNQVWEVRMALELFAMAQLKTRAENLDLQLLKESIALQEAAIDGLDYPTYLSADREFHSQLCGWFGNRRLQTTLEEIRDLIDLMALGALNLEGRMVAVLREHQKMLTALENGDFIGAVKALEHHLIASQTAVIEGTHLRAQVDAENNK